MAMINCRILAGWMLLIQSCISFFFSLLLKSRIKLNIQDRSTKAWETSNSRVGKLNIQDRSTKAWETSNSRVGMRKGIHGSDFLIYIYALLIIHRVKNLDIHKLSIRFQISNEYSLSVIIY
jgi:hypothetical protein